MVGGTPDDTNDCFTGNCPHDRQFLIDTGLRPPPSPPQSPPDGKDWDAQQKRVDDFKKQIIQEQANEMGVPTPEQNEANKAQRSGGGSGFEDITPSK
jgi:hypothetical protein